jgi:hypothetical protein
MMERLVEWTAITGLACAAMVECQSAFHPTV